MEALNLLDNIQVIYAYVNISMKSFKCLDFCFQSLKHLQRNICTELTKPLFLYTVM